MITKHIPNGITLLNVVAGCVAIVLALDGQAETAALFILLAAVFDFLDGMAARLFKAYSPMGKELDSLADVVSFGVAPAMILLDSLKTLAASTGADPLWAWMALLLPLAAGLRLAKFNVDDRQTTSFLGLPTPANALFWAFGTAYGLPIIAPSLTHPALLTPLILLFAGLMVSELPLFSLKISGLAWKENWITYLFLAGCLILFVSLGWIGMPASIGWYILLSLLTHKHLRQHDR